MKTLPICLSGRWTWTCFESFRIGRTEKKKLQFRSHLYAEHQDQVATSVFAFAAFSIRNSSNTRHQRDCNAFRDWHGPSHTAFDCSAKRACTRALALVTHSIGLCSVAFRRVFWITTTTTAEYVEIYGKHENINLFIVALNRSVDFFFSSTGHVITRAHAHFQSYGQIAVSRPVYRRRRRRRLWLTAIESFARRRRLVSWEINFFSNSLGRFLFLDCQRLTPVCVACLSQSTHRLRREWVQQVAILIY